MENNINGLVVSKTKIQNSFLIGNFVIDGLSTLCRLDRDSNGGGIMLYVKDNIPSNLPAIDKKIHREFLC